MAYEFGDTEVKTMLDLVASARIFGVEKTADGGFELSERCDDYFRVTITRDELIDLANELLALAEVE